MAEYDGRQRNQLSRAISRNGSKSKQLKVFQNTDLKHLCQSNLIKSMQKKSNDFNVNVHSKKSNVCQLLDLSKYNFAELNHDARLAYDLLKNNRAGFQTIDKSGGDVSAEQDSHKRVIKASKQISSTKGGRNPSLQATIGWLGNMEEGRMGGYNGGHLIADSLGGSGTWQNMVPQDGPENKWGDWRQYEKRNAKALERTGSPLQVVVKLGYTGDSVLPTSWESTMTDKDGNTLDKY